MLPMLRLHGSHWVWGSQSTQMTTVSGFPSSGSWLCSSPLAHSGTFLWYRRLSACNHITLDLRNHRFPKAMLLLVQRDAFLLWKPPVLEKLWAPFRAVCNWHACSHFHSEFWSLPLGSVWGKRHSVTLNFILHSIKSSSLPKSLAQYSFPYQHLLCSGKWIPFFTVSLKLLFLKAFQQILVFKFSFC